MLDILPGETLYSWALANHDAVPGAKIRESSQKLLGAGHALRQSDIPARLAQSPLAAGASDVGLVHLVRHHTIGGYYWPFLSEETRSKVLTSMRDIQSQHWRRLLVGMSRTRPMAHPLKACRWCVQEDQESIGRTYWHVCHQHPTTVACSTHRVRLTVFAGTTRTWLRPQDLTRSSGAETAADLTDLIACGVGEVFQQLASSMKIEYLRFSVKRRMVDIGAIHSMGSSTRRKLQSWFRSTGASRLAATTGNLESLSDGAWIQSLLWRTRRSRAPEWALLWSALDWSSASQACQALCDAVAGSGVSSDGQIELFPVHEPELMPPPTALRDAIHHCDSYEALQRETGLTRGELVYWFERVPGLRASWRTGLHKKFKRRAIEELSRARGAGLNWSQTSALCGAAIQWLGENSPEDLELLTSGIARRAAKQKPLF